MQSVTVKRPVPERCVVVYLDFLGYRELTPDALLKFKAALEMSLKDVPLPEGTKLDIWDYRIFSDNILLRGKAWSDPLVGIQLYMAILLASKIQGVMTTNGYLLRGAISVGQLYMDETILYGPALVDAYNTESKVAIYPRLILHDSVFEALSTPIIRTTFEQQPIALLTLQEDFDGHTFIDYLLLMSEAAAEHHKEYIETNLDMHWDEPYVWAKYAWMARYHNLACPRRWPDRPDLLIERHHFSKLQTIFEDRLPASWQPVDLWGTTMQALDRLLAKSSDAQPETEADVAEETPPSTG